MKRLTYLFSLLALVMLAGFLPSDSRLITGRVTDANNNLPIIGASVTVEGTSVTTHTSVDGKYEIKMPDGKTLVFTALGYKPKEMAPGKNNVLNVALQGFSKLEEIVVGGPGAIIRIGGTLQGLQKSSAPMADQYGISSFSRAEQNTENYSALTENRFRETSKTPLSTFSIDVDAASYSNVRRFINYGQMPPVDAVRTEEMINYFKYNYPQPNNGEPVSISSEVSAAPWNPEHKLVKIGLQGKNIPTETLPASNLVFLIDVSGSMNSANRLSLVQSSMKMLVDQLRAKDKVAIVVYAGAAGMVLPATEGSDKKAIKDAIDKLSAGGSTAGGAGIKLAYNIAEQNFIKNGNNRVILATDGDFNVGASSDADMQHLIEEKRQSGVFLTVLGYGMGNYKDSKMETLADKGNGNYAYIDNFNEARKVLVNEFGGTLFTIVKDVKLQLEFNPAKVKAYRLIGYENRMLNKEDFNNDKKDAGELGSGHTVTALYEIIPAGTKSSFIESVDGLKYQKSQAINTNSNNRELLTVKLRYKQPEGENSKLMVSIVNDEHIRWAQTSADFRFAAAVAGYGMLLRKSEFKQGATFEKIISWAQSALGNDPEGYRAEFLKMVKSTALISRESLSSTEK